jgi:predicted Holliday junction resolvase-like endonuclease
VREYVIPTALCFSINSCVFREPVDIIMFEEFSRRGYPYILFGKVNCGKHQSDFPGERLIKGCVEKKTVMPQLSTGNRKI